MFRGAKTVETPEWALELLVQLQKEYKFAPLMLVWGVHKGTHRFKGHCSFDHIQIAVGDNASMDLQRRTLLHEIAHAIRDDYHRKGNSHTVAFYELAFELYERFGVEVEDALMVEYGYKKCAKRGFFNWFGYIPLWMETRDEAV